MIWPPQALSSHHVDRNYYQCWSGLQSHFDRNWPENSQKGSQEGSLKSSRQQGSSPERMSENGGHSQQRQSQEAQQNGKAAAATAARDGPHSVGGADVSSAQQQCAGPLSLQARQASEHT